MGTYSFNNHALRTFCETIKDAVDPNGILAPGRVVRDQFETFRNLALLAKGYNLTNKVNITGYAGPANVGNATGAVITGLTPVATAAQTMRQVQLGARFDF